MEHKELVLPGGSPLHSGEGLQAAGEPTWCFQRAQLSKFSIKSAGEEEIRWQAELELAVFYEKGRKWPNLNSLAIKEENNFGKKPILFQ